MSWLVLLAACQPERATVTPVAEVALATEAAPGRAPKRMDVDQLAASIERVTGGIAWTEVDEAGDEVALFDALSGTLGKPDYLDSTEEDLTAGLLFQKFLDDAAKSSCAKLVAREIASPADTRVFLTHVDPAATRADDPAGVEATVRAALLRFHGRSVPAGDARAVPWARLFEEVTTLTGDPAAGWNAVCVALLTHPDFYGY